MKISTMLAGAAAPITALMLCAAPLHAQSYGYYGNGPQYSTPQEQAQTRALNQQGVDGSTQSPAVLNGEAQPGSDEGEADFGNPQPVSPYGDSPDGNSPGPQQQYDEQMQQYGAQQQQYQQEYEQYEGDVRAYDRALYDWDYPAPPDVDVESGPM